MWNVPCKLAFPSATQNEVSGADAANRIKNGCVLVCEGANMPSTPEAVEAFLQACLLYTSFRRAGNVRLLSEKGLHLATAESCTGGLVAKLITDVSGASEVFGMGLVT